MAIQRYQFGFRNVELFKEDTLGTGSYGGVCKARCDGLPCAAKIMHPTLFDLRDPGTVSYLQRFEEECRLLSSARHPNVVQYLGTHRDPETRLPVLLMELCDESLCCFLERSPRPIPYHIQLNIAHDIALALVYLHLNNITHRDLTANNVLMIAGVHAKVTDFGMSKLASVNPHMTPMTLCPGNVQYMSPEALEEPPSYTHKLDVFSFGVLLVQIMTRQFPNPGPRFQVVSVPNFPEGTVRRAVPETERRSSHLQIITDTHPLKAIAITCLKSKEQERPSAQRLNKTLSGLKQAPAYTQSLQQAQTDMEGEEQKESLRSEIQDLQHMEMQQKDEVIAQKQRENEQLQTQVQQLKQQLQEKEREVQEKARESKENNGALLKQAPAHTQSLQQAQTGMEGEEEKESPRGEIQDLQHQNHTLKEEMQQKEEIIAQKQRENEQLRAQVQQLKQQKEREVQEKARESKKNNGALLKQVPAHTQSLQQARTGMEGEEEEESLRSEIQDLQHQNHTLKEEMQQKEEALAHKQREIEQFQAQLQQRPRSWQVSTKAKTRKILQLPSTVHEERELQEKERKVQEKDHAIRTTKQLVAQFQRALVEKDKVTSDLQQTISAQKQPVSPKIGKTATATVSQQDVSKLRWNNGKKAPKTMWRGSTVVGGNKVYIAPFNSLKIYSCQITSQDLLWSTLPDVEYFRSSLTVIGGILTTVGGDRDSKFTNSLLSLIGRGGRRRWSKIFPAMPTPRSQTVSVTTQQTLIVAGGIATGENLNIVEVMNNHTKQWTTASHLPHPFGVISGTICGDQLYLAGGYDGFAEYGQLSKSVLTCSVTDLLSPPSLAAGPHTLSLADKTGVWRHARDLPVTQSTLITLGGHLLAIGGWNAYGSGRDTADIHHYDTHTDSWQVVSRMKNRRRLCMAAVLPEDCILVVGGLFKDSVEIGSLQ